MFVVLRPYQWAMEAPSGRQSLNRRRQPAAWMAAGPLILIAVAVVATAAADGRGHGSFAWLRPTSVPANWDRVSPPGGAAVLSYPPSFGQVRSDPGAVSVAVGNGPRYLAYLNVTPRQGRESLRSFATLRVNLIGADHDSNVHLEGSLEGVPLHPGRASAVADDYITRVGRSHYREISVFVVGQHGSWVIVGAALNSEFVRFQSDLQQAIAAFAFSST